MEDLGSVLLDEARREARRRLIVAVRQLLELVLLLALGVHEFGWWRGFLLLTVVVVLTEHGRKG